jgi:hypothetical protein
MRCFEPKPDADRFKKEIERRQITHLVHFTPTVNLLGMCEQGRVLSRQAIQAFCVDAPDLALGDFVEFNDALRLDNMRGCINTSVMFPNHYLFTRFRQKRDLAYLQWCVLKIAPKYIYEKGTLFSIANAASSAARARYPVSGEFETFAGMFADIVEFPTANGLRHNTRRGLKVCHTTDVQAEVMVEMAIPIADVQEVCFKDQADLAITAAALRTQDFDPGFKYTVAPDLFGTQRG